MTATAERPATRPAKKPKGGAPAAFVAGLPQVNLLPPEVRAARSLSVVKRWLGISLVAVLVLVALGYGGAVLARSAADAELSAAEDTQIALRAEEATYAEVPRVLGAITQTTLARDLGMAPEVSWKSYLDAISAVLPVGMSIDDFALTGPSPVALPVTGTDPLQGASIGNVALQVRSTTPPVAADLIDALDALPGLDSTWVSSVATAEEEGTTYYAVSLTAQLNDAALLQRFAAEQPAAAEGDE
ncbi:fimbrial assembly protein [Cellulomonas sp. NPDC058312]|uniref:fimbrial assembly protein n=1 Tax=Cellulomonas sp. NPDC058312 TaxID=3346441 RepID=UPI0036EC5BD9